MHNFRTVFRASICRKQISSSDKMCLCELEVNSQFSPQSHMCLPVVGISLYYYLLCCFNLPGTSSLFPVREASSTQTFWAIKPEQIICQAGQVLARLFHSPELELFRWHCQTSHGTPDDAEVQTIFLRKLPSKGVVHQVVVPQINRSRTWKRVSEWEILQRTSKGIRGSSNGIREINGEFRLDNKY